MLRFHLPPNLAAAIVRNAVPLRVELDLSQAPEPELIPALALLQRWCGPGTPPKFIQLSRAQLRELTTAAGPLPLFVENGKPSTWRHDLLLSDPNDSRPPSSSSASATRPAPST